MNKFLVFIINAYLIHHSFASIIKIDDNNVRAPGDTVKVNVFYENLNAVNRKFFVEEFRPVIDHLWDIIDLQLIPYGTTKKEGDVFTCTHENQCLANKAQACAIGIINESNEGKPSDQDLKEVALFVHCMVKNRKLEGVAEEAPHCSNLYFIDEWPDITQCINGPDGIKFTNEMYTKTGSIKDSLKNGMAIQINGAISEEASADLVKAVCDAYEATEEKPKPERCNTAKANKIKVSVFYEALNIDTRNYFNHQLQPFYHILEDIVDIDLVPYGNTKFADNQYTCESHDICIANRIQAIAVDDFITTKDGDEVDGPTRVIKFIDCMSNHKKWQNIYIAGEQCANEHLPANVWTHMLVKANTTEGDVAYAKMKDKTAKVNPTPGSPLPRIPFATINDKENIMVVNDFVHQVCQDYTGYKPSVCTRVKVQVFYEALNHKSRRFIMEELNPAFKYFQNLIDLELYPAGRAKRNDHGGFECTNEDQCTGNKYQVCIIDDFWNDGADWVDPIRQEVMEVIYCMAQNKRAVGITKAAEQCSERTIPDAWPTIKDCLDSGRVNSIFDDYIQITHSSGLELTEETIPVITIDGKQNDDAKVNLIKVLCDHFDDDHKPDKCTEGKAPKIAIDVYYESMNSLSKTFFTKQLPNYKHIEELVDIQLFPNGNVDDNSGIINGTCNTDMPACVANKIQAIAIDMFWLSDDNGDQIDGSIRTTHFLECIFNHQNWSNADNFVKAAEYCVDSYLPFDKWMEIWLDTKLDIGHNIYKKVQEKTKQLKDSLSPPVTSLSPIPYVVGSGKHSLQMANDLLQTVCELYTGDKPLECEPVIVEIYYETLNPQSRKFFVEELRLTFENIRESFVFDLIPFGRTKMKEEVEGKPVFDCPLGEQQCLGNKIQACAIRKFLHTAAGEVILEFDAKNQTLLFIHCMFKNENDRDITEVAYKCATDHFLDDVAEELVTCAKTEEGDLLLKEMATRTHNLRQPLEHSPWIVINSERNALAQSQLEQVICDNLLGDRPDVCEEGRAPKVKVDFHYQTGDPAVKDYILDELYPSYRDIEEITDLELTAFGLTTIRKTDDGKYEFTCPNGDNECIGNKIHTCVIREYWHNDDDPISDNKDYDGKLQTLEFLKCYFSDNDWQTDPIGVASRCVVHAFDDEWVQINQCVADGDALFAELGEKVSAISPPVRYTPWIIVNGKHSKASELHLTRAVCDGFEGKSKPGACNILPPPLEKPNVEIHYEPLNTDTQHFVISQLDHLKTHVDEIIILDIIPFGRTVKNSDNTFQCPNDEGCHTYKEHACVMTLFLESKPIETLSFLKCVFGSDMTNVPKVTEECANANFDPDPWGDIQTCAKARGDALLEEYFKRVNDLNPKLSHSPWVLVNGEHNLEAEDALVQEICDTFYPTDKPSQCIPELLSVAINYQTMDTDVASFVANQIKPYQPYFEELAAIEFVPFGLTERDGTEFKCPQNQDQCSANKVHTCVMHNFWDKLNHSNVIDLDESRYRTLGFLVCSFGKSTSKPIDDAEQCLNQEMGIGWWDNIFICAHGSDGTKLYEDMAKKTELLDPKISKVPWVTINNQNNIEAETSLVHAICESYPTVRPPVCSSIGKVLINIGLYYSSNSAGRDWVNNQLKPIYSEIAPTSTRAQQRLQSILSTQFIPWGQTTYDPNNADKPFTCETDNECTANRIQACAIEHYSTEPKGWQHLTEFIICFFSHEEWQTNPSNAGNVCANKVWIVDPWEFIGPCSTSNTPENIAIYLKQQRKNELAKPDKYPWITVEGEHNPDAENDLLATVCDEYSGLKPLGCPTVTQKPGPTTTPNPDTTTTTTENPDTTTTTTENPDTTKTSDKGPDPVTPTTLKPTTDGALSVTITNCLFIIVSLILFL